jgi:hypothetical protein
VAHQLDQRLVVESKFRLGTAGPAEQIDFGDHDRPEFLIERVDLRPTRKAQFGASTACLSPHSRKMVFEHIGKTEMNKWIVFFFSSPLFRLITGRKKWTKVDMIVWFAALIICVVLFGLVFTL